MHWPIAFRFSVLLASALGLGACAHYPGAWQPAASWPGMCYDDMHAQALTLAAPAATDCGFASLAGGAGAARQVRTCAKAALKAGTPFIAGYQGIGTDSGYCQVVVRLPEKRWAQLDVDYDQTGGVHTGSGPMLVVQACADVAVPGDDGAPFVARDCAASEALRARLAR